MIHFDFLFVLALVQCFKHFIQVVAHQGAIHTAVYMTPLQAAIKVIRSHALVEVLIRQGAKIDIADEQLARDEGLDEGATFLNRQRQRQIAKAIERRNFRLINEDRRRIIRMLELLGC